MTFKECQLSFIVVLGRIGSLVVMTSFLRSRFVTLNIRPVVRFVLAYIRVLA
jgi:hypothetical protein